MLFGWPSVRHMRRGLPKTELQRLHDFYIEYGLLQGFLEEPKPGDEEPEHPADKLSDWEAERIRGGPT